MASLTIRNLPDEVRDKLRIRAAENRRSMEAEVRHIVTNAVAPTSDSASREELRERVRAMQERVAKYIPPGSYTVDQFLKEKREEAAAEELKWQRLEREAKAAASKSSSIKKSRA